MGQHLTIVHDVSEERALSSVAISALKVLLYYDIFKYPLTATEIHESMSLSGISLPTLEPELFKLVDAGHLFQYGEFFLVNDIPELVERRKEGNKRAKALMSKARKVSRFIGKFPFVQGVCLSGSISKGYCDATTDIDYFVITDPGRLWIARTLLIAYKKIFLFNSYKYFCLNYFVDTNHMEIEEKNVFTATEVATLIPTFNGALYYRFRATNKWIQRYLPNYREQDTSQIQRPKTPFLSTLMESCLNNSLGNWLDRFFMRLTIDRWKQKFGHYERDDFDVAMKSRKYVSKHHPGNFQRVVLERLEENCRLYETTHGVQLS